MIEKSFLLLLFFIINIFFIDSLALSQNANLQAENQDKINKSSEKKSSEKKSSEKESSEEKSSEKKSSEKKSSEEKKSGEKSSKGESKDSSKESSISEESPFTMSGEEKKPKKSKDTFRHHYIYLQLSVQNDRILSALKSSYGNYELGPRDSNLGFSGGWGFLLWWRIWPEFNLYYYSKKGYSVKAISSNLLFTFFYRKRIPIAIYFKAGVGYCVINPEFPIPEIWDPLFNVGIRFKFRVWKGIFLFAEYENTIIALSKFKYKNNQKREVFLSQSKDISKFQFGAGYHF
jgi:hypothetical protein